MHAIEKILAKNSGRKEVRTGEIVTAKVDFAEINDLYLQTVYSFYEMGGEKVWDNTRCAFVFDHYAPCPDIKSAANHKEMREFAQKNNLKFHFDTNCGVCHQVMPEAGVIYPGMIVVATDSHTTTHGAFGAMGTGCGATDMATILMTGELWFRVPEIIEDVNAVKKGHVEVLTHTPGGFPVYAVTYGKKLPQRKVNWPSLTGSKHPEYYSNTAQQTLMFIAGIHAEETEGVMTLSNFISLLETGKDRRGKTNDHLVELAQHYRIVLLPCVNMDGRSFAPDCLMGCSPADYGPIQTRLKNWGYWSGKYLISKVKHDVTPNNGYVCVLTLRKVDEVAKPKASATATALQLIRII